VVLIELKTILTIVMELVAETNFSNYMQYLPGF